MYRLGKGMEGSGEFLEQKQLNCVKGIPLGATGATGATKPQGFSDLMKRAGSACRGCFCGQDKSLRRANKTDGAMG